MAYLNGQYPDSALAKTSNGHSLIADAASSYDRLNAAFKKQFGYELKITQGYRSLAQQTTIFLQRYKVQATGGGYYGDVRWWKLKRYVRIQGTASAATPGKSNHGLGLALDLNTGIGFGSFASAQYKWLAANGGAYGWDNREGRAINEPWHWVYNSANDKHKGSSGTAAKPKPTSGGINVANLPVIKPGMKGTAVRRFQGLLMANGYNIGRAGIDGSNGPSTQSAFRAFQLKNPDTGTNGKPDNSGGPRAWAKLLGL